MITVDGQSNCQRQQFRTTAQGPDNQVPVLDSLFAEYSDSDRGAKKCQKALEIQFKGNLGRFIFP
jgi:hypothetical protein